MSELSGHLAQFGSLHRTLDLGAGCHALECPVRSIRLPNPNMPHGDTLPGELGHVGA